MSFRQKIGTGLIVAVVFATSQAVASKDHASIWGQVFVGAVVWVGWFLLMLDEKP